MSITPTVSVIVPAYNALRFLPQAVESVQRQTFKDLELIIVDDGSADATPLLVASLEQRDGRIRGLRQPNGGLSSARNAGIAAARGEYLCFLDADDAFLPEKLERQLAFLASSPSCDLVYSDHYIGDDGLNPISLQCRRPPEMPLAELLSFRNWFAPMSPLVSARLVARVGRFDEGLTSAEDWDYWIRASRCGVFAYLAGPVGIYRTHPGQMHHNWPRMRSNQEKVIRKNFAPGSRPWHLAQAAHAWSGAKRAKSTGNYLRMAASLCGVAWHARSGRTLLTITQLAN